MSESGTAVKLPQYRCHKVVGGLKLKIIVENQNGSVDLSFMDEQFDSITIEQPDAHRFIDRDRSDLGYYVEYRDGYFSWLPTKEFEDGYTLIIEDHDG